MTADGACEPLGDIPNKGPNRGIMVEDDFNSNAFRENLAGCSITACLVVFVPATAVCCSRHSAEMILPAPLSVL
jgi:hypothetical protein